MVNNSLTSRLLFKANAFVSLIVSCFVLLCSVSRSYCSRVNYSVGNMVYVMASAEADNLDKAMYVGVYIASFA